MCSLARLPLPLHLAVAQDTPSLPPRQQGLGVPEVRPVGVCESEKVLKGHHSPADALRHALSLGRTSNTTFSLSR